MHPIPLFLVSVGEMLLQLRSGTGKGLQELI